MRLASYTCAVTVGDGEVAAAAGDAHPGTQRVPGCTRGLANTQQPKLTPFVSVTYTGVTIIQT